MSSSATETNPRNSKSDLGLQEVDAGFTNKFNFTAFSRRLYLLLFIHTANFLALSASIFAGWWGDSVVWTVPALASFLISGGLLVTLVASRGAPAVQPEQYRQEIYQTTLRLFIGTVLQSYATVMARGVPEQTQQV